MEHRVRTLLRAAVDAALVVAGSVAIGVVVVTGGLAWLDDVPYRGAATEAGYAAVAVAALAVCGSGALVGLRVLTTAVRAPDGSHGEQQETAR